MRKVTVSQVFREAVSVPMIRLRGKWLRMAGFEKGTLLRVDISFGKLILTTTDGNTTNERVRP
jgi:hypothetical protein